jgi:neutral ceramidase
MRSASVAALAALLCACNASPPPDAEAAAKAKLGACVLKSPALKVGENTDLTVGGVTYTHSHQPDAPGPLETPLRNVGHVSGPCASNNAFRFGAGLYDTTGPIGGDPTGHADLEGMVFPPQAPNGIHTRLYSRAFAIESPCNGKRIVFISDEHAFPSALMRQEVLKGIAADAALKPFYGPDNVLISGTHTHAAPGGFGDPSLLPRLPTGTPQPLVDAFDYAGAFAISPVPYDDDNFKAIVDGMVQAVRRAHANLEAHADAAPIKLSIGELLNANRNRDPPAYMQNSPAERARYLDKKGHEITVDKRFVQLSFVRGDGSAAGVLNWFGVHPTAMGNHELLISSDTKGYAALGFEKLMGTRYQPDGDGAPAGGDNFVAAFAQTDEGNSIPDLFVFDKDVNGSDAPGAGVPYRYRFGTDDPYNFDEEDYARGSIKATAIYGTKQLAQALKQFDQGTPLSGPVDYRFFFVDMNKVTVTDPVVLGRVAFPDLPATLYADDPKETCENTIGISKGVGGANGPALGAGGFVCVQDAPVPYEDAMRNHFNGLFNGTNSVVVEKDNQPVVVPFNGVAGSTVLTPLLCQRNTLLQPDKYGCQKEKPPIGAVSLEPAPFQLFRVGNLAIIGVPWEVTTMAARRLRQTVLDALAPAGVDTVVIAGLSNTYLDYLATREEYSAQAYEGASTDYGPWQLAAVQQEMRRLALALANGQPAPQGPVPADLARGDPSPITTDAPANFGAIVTDAHAQYAQGETVDVTFTAGYPGNDLKTMSSYLYVERKDGDAWSVVATDKDPELLFLWNWTPTPVTVMAHVVDSSTAQAVWTIPLNTPNGTYRIRHTGVSRASTSAPPTPYEGVSSEFVIAGTPAECP